MIEIATTEIAKLAVMQDAYQDRHIIKEWDFASGLLVIHRVRTHHGCPKCGPSQQQKSLKLAFGGVQKTWEDECGPRGLAPGSLLTELEGLISPLCGLVPEVVVGKVRNQYVCSSALPFPCGADVQPGRHFRIPSIVVGTGSTSHQAKIACLAEAVERYSSSLSMAETEVIEKAAALKQRWIDPRELLCFSTLQYETRHAWNQKHGPFNQVPEPYTEAESLHWLTAWSLTYQEPVLLPSTYCHIYTPYHGEARQCPGDSNGLASGSSLDEAIYYGVLEVIERDAVGIWWYNRVPRPQLDISHLMGKVATKNVERMLAQFGRELVALDITSDIGIPTVVAVSWQENGGAICLGSASAFSMAVALRRAISELSQGVSCAQQLISTSLFPSDIPGCELQRWLMHENLQDHAFLSGTKHAEALNYLCDHKESELFSRDVLWCINKLKHLGHEVIVADLTKPDLALSVAKVVVPGLRHFWARFAPGRLYDVPLKMGWLTIPNSEDQLNPISYFL